MCLFDLGSRKWIKPQTGEKRVINEKENPVIQMTLPPPQQIFLIAGMWL